MNAHTTNYVCMLYNLFASFNAYKFLSLSLYRSVEICLDYDSIYANATHIYNSSLSMTQKPTSSWGNKKF